MTVKPKLLIIEDKLSTLDRLKKVMESPPAQWFEQTGRIAFHVDVAITAEEARKCLAAANKRGQPYEVVLLDLSLPGTQEDVRHGVEEQHHGRSLLKEITSESDTAVVILTGHPDTENLIHAVQYGATDFVLKPLATRDDERMLYVRLVAAVGKTREVVHRSLRFERLARLKDHDSKSHRDALSRFVSEHTSQISDSLRQLAQLLSRRFGVDPDRDAEDSICKQLTTIGQAADRMKQFVFEKTPGEEDPSGFHSADVSAIVVKEIARARPCYLHRQVELHEEVSEKLHTRTFPDDLRLIVAELLIGSLEVSPEGTATEVSCEQSDDGRDIVVSLVRSGERVPKHVLRLLSKGEWRHKRPDGKWRGLCFLQRVANNIGARLVLSNQGERQAVALRIPVILDE